MTGRLYYPMNPEDRDTMKQILQHIIDCEEILESESLRLYSEGRPKKADWVRERIAEIRKIRENLPQ